MTIPYLNDAAAALTRWEGSVPWMYLDTRGNVTTGVGHLLASVRDARTLPFLAGDRLATPVEVAADWARVQAMQAGMAAARYRVPGSLMLDPEIIASLLRVTLSDLDAQLRRLSWYLPTPEPVKLAMLDMAYNLGVTGLLRGFPLMLAALKDGDWKMAAADCFRNGPGASRNHWTAQQIMLASAAAPGNAAPGVAKEIA